MKTPKFTDAQLTQALSTVSGWSLNGSVLEKNFPFSAKGTLSPFMQGLLFIERIAALAEHADHHPDILFTYPSVTIMLTTHDSGGVTEKDFDLAKQVDGVFAG
jgi:4a-hydroxytetrahydrobiopterin dehydratase